MTPQGQVITFYSFKGGTGRTQVLANVAFLLACQGHRVCAVDWDLEAPGLHRYFHPFLADPSLLATEGLIDFLWALSAKALTRGDCKSQPSAEVDVMDYIVGVDWDFPDGGLLDFLPAGRQGPDYAGRATSFQWESFYERLGGGKSLESARQQLVGEYEYVLIDSRTGISDTSGICTVQMPDRLVACYTLNRQSIEGVFGVLESIAKRRAESIARGHRRLPIFPLEMRVENSEKFKLESARRLARPTFDKFLEDHPRVYWEDMEIAYWPFYAFEECLSVFGDDSSTPSRSSMISAMERVARRVTGLPNVSTPSVSAAERERVLRSYSLSGDSPMPIQVPAPDSSSETSGESPVGSSSVTWSEVWAEAEAYYRNWLQKAGARSRRVYGLSRGRNLLPRRLVYETEEARPIPPRLLENEKFMLFLAQSRDWPGQQRRMWMYLGLSLAIVLGFSAIVQVTYYNPTYTAAVAIGGSLLMIVAFSGVITAPPARSIDTGRVS